MKSPRFAITAAFLFILFSFTSSSFSAPVVAGDVDLSGAVDASDVQMVINGALGLPVSGMTNIDFNADTDAVDVQLVINAALRITIDTDGDGLADAGEANLCSDVNIADTDCDGVSDGQEVLDGTNPCGEDVRPILFPLPKVTTDSTVTVRGCAESADGIIIRDGIGETVGQTVPDSCFFEIPVDLSMGTNELRVYGESGGVEGHPAYADIVRAEPSLVLDDITPASGQSGTIVTLTGSGFVPDKDEMTAYFKGSLQEAEGKTLEVTDSSMTVVVPFVFLDTDEGIAVYVYSSVHVSNPRLRTRRATKWPIRLTRCWLKFRKCGANWSSLLNLTLTMRYGASSMRIFTGWNSSSDDEMLARLDSVFGSDVFVLIQEKLEQINELLSHSTDGEALCHVNEVIGILDDIIDILDWVHWALRAGEVICFFVCQPALPVLEVAVEIGCRRAYESGSDKLAGRGDGTVPRHGPASHVHRNHE